MKQMSLIEMDGFLKGKCIPRDLKVNETNAEYLVRKFAEAEAKISALSEDHQRAIESIKQADVAQAIENLKQKLVECNRYNYCADAVKGVEDACHTAMLQGKESDITTITDKKQYPSDQYLNELITNMEFAARAPVEVVRVMAAELQKRREADSAEPVSQTYNLPELIEGMEVSIDVSTCDADLGNRYFGTVTEALELDTAKNGYILLVQDAEPNFDVNSNSPVTPDSWISCSERMPEKGQNVLISVNFDSSLVEPLICSARYTGSTFRRGDATIKPGNGIEQATHWMPLPEPPQEVNRG